MQQISPEFTMERYGPLKTMDRSFDIGYWQRLGPAAIFDAAWQMVLDVHTRESNHPDELRLQRTIESFQREER